MIPQANITAWRTQAPWPDDAQVEQDLVLTRALIELFSTEQLEGKIARRGGTALQKLFIRPPCRYSEDIDLVQTQPGAIGIILDACREKLDAWLGVPRRIRSADSVSLVYRFQSEIPPIRPLRLKIEINTREHFAVLGYSSRNFSATNRWYSGETQITTYEIDELLATKLRALYQRRKGRDLFDLWLCLDRALITPQSVVSCFGKYLQHQGLTISRAQFEQNLHGKETDSTFLHDITPLLQADIDYDALKAMKSVKQSLIELLPGDPWRGLS